MGRYHVAGHFEALRPARGRRQLFEIWLNSSEANGAGEPETATETADGVELTWIEAGLELRARISTDAETGVVRLSGGMKNVGGAPVTLTRANWRFTLAERQYSLYTQAGGWSRENRGGWHSFDAGEMAISSEWGAPRCRLRRSWRCATKAAGA